MSLFPFRKPARPRDVAARFWFAGCPFPAEAATSGIAIFGAPGSGKSVLKNQTTDDIVRAIVSRRRGEPWSRALIYAHKAPQVLRHLRHLGVRGEDVAIFHPGRTDCRPLAESLDYVGQDGIFDFIKLLLPDNSSNEPFWMMACQSLGQGAANVFSRTAVGPWHTDDCLYAFSDQARLRWVLGHWEGNSALIQSFFGSEAERTRQNVLFTLETHSSALRVSAKQLRAARGRGNRPFSFVHDWMSGDGPRVVVVCHAPTYSKSWGGTFVPLIINTAIRAFKEHTQHTPLNDDLTLFDFDEFVQFKLAEPAEFFATARELGGVPLIAVQSIPLLYSVYGQDLGRGILSTLSFQAYGATNDDGTAELASNAFGEHELERIPRDLSQEPHVIREPRVPKDAFLQENDGGTLRFFCRATGLGKWRYDIRRRDIIRNAPRVEAKDLEEEQRLRAPSADFEPWTEEDLRRLGLRVPQAGSRWPDFLDPNANWRHG